MNYAIISHPEKEPPQWDTLGGMALEMEVSNATEVYHILWQSIYKNSHP